MKGFPAWFEQDPQCAIHIPAQDQLSKWIKPAPTVSMAPTRRYDVVVSNVMVRSLPSTAASAVGVVKMGEVLEGQVREGWLLLLGELGWWD